MRRALVITLAAVMFSAFLATVPASAAVSHPRPAPRGFDTRSITAPRPETRTHVDGPTQGENPPGRVSQEAGQAGYVVPVSGTSVVTIQATITVPSITCTTGSSSSWPLVTSSQADPGLFLFGSTIGSTFITLELVSLYCDNGDNVYYATSTIDPNCSSGVCPFEPFTGGQVVPGDQVLVSVSTSSSGSSVSAVDESNGASIAFAGGQVVTGSVAAGFLVDDACWYGDLYNCNVLQPSSAGVPPSFADYSPIAWSGAEINGTGLGSFLTGSSVGNWQQFNSVWTATVLDQSTFVGSGDSFDVNNAFLALPSLSVTSQNVDEKPSGTQDMTFPVVLSASSSYPVYVDYSTGGGNAVAGTNYTAESGTLTFDPGVTTQDVVVPILPGASTGGLVYFDLALSNPSYAVGGGNASGTIYLGPYVESITSSVSPPQVPLTGGPTVTVNGYDFQGPSVAPAPVNSVRFCLTGGSNSCVSGTNVSVVSDTTLTVTAPDASSIQPSKQTEFLTDTIATNTNNVSSPINASDSMSPTGDELQFGCTQQSVTDGAWLANGCITDEQNNDDVAQQDSTIDGVNVDVSGSETDDVSYDPSSDDVVASQPVTVSLPLQGNPVVEIFKGKLSKALSGPISFTIPADTKLAGLAISGKLTLTPLSTKGQADGTVNVTLPPVLGGGKAELTFEVNTGATSLNSVTVKVTKANFMHLFALSDLTLSYSDKGTWSVSGTASTGGTTSTKFSGSLTYANNSLSKASLKVSAISLAGMVDISNLTVNYDGTSWSGSATIKQAKQTGTVSLSFTGTTLTSAEISTGPVALFGLVNVDSFDLTYGSSGWSLEVTGPGGGNSASLKVSNGVITSARLTLTDLPLAKVVTIQSATLSYTASGTNSACTSVTGTEIWCGSWDIAFPDAGSPVSGVSGALAFQDGQFVSGSVKVKGSVPLIDGVFLTELGAALKLNPTVVSGSATVSFGPQVSGVSALSVSGTLTRTFPSSGSGGSYEASGTVTALPGSSHSLTLGSVDVTVPDSGATKVALTLGGGSSGLTVSAGSATATIAGSITGTFTSSTFSLAGSVTVTVPVGTFTGNLKADNTGVAACAKYGSHQVGFEYDWQTGSLSVLDTSGCTEKGF